MKRFLELNLLLALFTGVVCVDFAYAETDEPEVFLTEPSNPCDPIIYGDTDSVFFKFNLEELDGTPIIGQKALELTIELAQEAGELATKFLKPPHDLEYEKTFLPFCLLSKKRYLYKMFYNHIHVLYLHYQ